LRASASGVKGFGNHAAASTPLHDLAQGVLVVSDQDGYGRGHRVGPEPGDMDLDDGANARAAVELTIC
jgi:hypothetical protein